MGGGLNGIGPNGRLAAYELLELRFPAIRGGMGVGEVEHSFVYVFYIMRAKNEWRVGWTWTMRPSEDALGEDKDVMWRR